eukprot:621959-Prymnesium_polylepis.1
MRLRRDATLACLLLCALQMLFICLTLLPTPSGAFVQQHSTPSGVIVRRLQDRHRVLSRVNATLPQCPELDVAAPLSSPAVHPAPCKVTLFNRRLDNVELYE